MKFDIDYHAVYFALKIDFTSVRFGVFDKSGLLCTSCVPLVLQCARRIASDLETIFDLRFSKIGRSIQIR